MPSNTKRHNNATKQHFSLAPPFTKMSLARPPLLHLSECQVNGTFKTCFDMLIARSSPPHSSSSPYAYLGRCQQYLEFRRMA